MGGMGGFTGRCTLYVITTANRMSCERRNYAYIYVPCKVHGWQRQTAKTIVKPWKKP
jgi:hypothetical protein